MMKLSQKTILIVSLIVLLFVPLSLSEGMPQFLIFQGSVEIDDRVAVNGTIVRFYINEIEVDSSSVNNGEYGFVIIQGYNEYYGNKINITINGYEAEQEVYYIFPQDIYLNLSTTTENILKIVDLNPTNLNVVLEETQYQLFSITYSSGYNNSVIVEWYLNDEKVSNEDSYNFTTSYDSSGSYNLKVNLSDGYTMMENSWNIIVNDKNRNPVVSEIEDQEWDEDTELLIDLSDYFSDPDGDILSYSYSGLEGNIEVSIVNNIAILIPDDDWNGVGEVIFSGNDNKGGIVSSNIVNLIVNAVEDVPVISDYNPKYNPIIGDNILQTFSIMASDPDGTTPEIKWFLDGNLEDEDSNAYSKSFIAREVPYNVSVLISDGFYNVLREWNVLVSDKPILDDEFNGDTTNFDFLNELQLANAEEVVLEKSLVGKIEFLETLDLRDVVDIKNTVEIKNGLVAIDTNIYPQLNKKAKITLIGLSYTTVPKIYYNDGFTLNPNEITKECDFCGIINYTKMPTTNGVVVFNVDHFSSFKSEGGGDKYDLDNFKELDKCEGLIGGDLKVDIDEPDNNDEFKPDEAMKIELKIENIGSSKLDVRIKAILYSIDEDDIIESVHEKKKINRQESENINLNLEIPDDLDHNNDYILFVKVYDNDDEENNCNYDIKDVDIKRERDDVRIRDFRVSSLNVNQGDSISFSVDVENFGTKEKDVVIKLENKNLNLDLEKSFKLERYNEDNTASERFEFVIPQDIKSGSYNIALSVLFDSEIVYTSQILTIEPKVMEEGLKIVEKSEYIEPEIQAKVEEMTVSWKPSEGIYIFSLFLVNLLFIVLIFYIIARKLF